MRRFILVNIDNIAPFLNSFIFITLCIHCFTNEYVYFENEEETRLVFNLESTIASSIIKTGRPEIIKLLCLASYRSLHKYNWCRDLTALNHYADVKKRLITEPLAENEIAQNCCIRRYIRSSFELG